MTLKYLRAGAITYAIDKMRMSNDYPVIIRANKNNPNQTTEWNNFTEILWKFYVHYCAAEGYVQGQDAATGVKNYLFHGAYMFTRKVRDKKMTTEKPVIHALHFMLTLHRSRFITDTSGPHFKKFLALIELNPTWRQFFDDKGEGSPPLAYLIAVEEVLLGFTVAKNCKQTMGLAKITTPEVWRERVHVWRKKEGYTSVIRFCRKRYSYRKWTDFLLRDMIERNVLGQTFVNRHHGLSDDDFQGRLQYPVQWTNEPTGKTSKRKPSSKSSSEPQVKKSKRPPPQRFDKKTNAFVDLT